MKRIARRFIHPLAFFMAAVSFFLSDLAGASIFFPVVLNDKGLCPQIICNGGFENGNDGTWLTTSTNALGGLIIVNLNDFGIPNHSGSHAAWLGGDPGEITTIAQQINVPLNATQLDFWFWVDSNAVPGNSRATVLFDTTSLKVYDLSEGTTTGGWVNDRIDVPAAFRGKAAFLIFKAEIAPDPTGVVISSFLLDDVSLIQGLQASVTTENPGPTPNNQGPFFGLRKTPRAF